MLKAALILGCLLSLTLASPLKERQERRRLARSDSDSYERLSINPLLLQILINLLTTTTTATTTPTTTTTTPVPQTAG
ncbi:unnamed protein product [Knipowitschia caucasica]